VHRSGTLVASRVRSRSDIWRFPIAGSPAENTLGAVRVTHQAGRVQTPSVSADGSELVYLSDSGGRANLWIANVATGESRQLTFDQEAGQGVSVPVWSPAGDRIAFLRSRRGEPQLWTIKIDGSGLRQLPMGGYYATWSPDGQWIYFSPPNERPWRIARQPSTGGEIENVRQDDAVAPALAADGTMYYASMINPGEFTICAVHPGQDDVRVLTRLSESRIPTSPALIHMFLSPDGGSLALPLLDGPATNLWVVSTRDGAMRPLTDFGERAVLMSRRIAWAPDGQSLFAAVEESDADVVSLTGLLLVDASAGKP
jgi:dipeptidyl aminopeptidase/acylaminoacyl peptidase